jgi:hypothetical protein
MIENLSTNCHQTVHKSEKGKLHEGGKGKTKTFN